MRTSLYRKFFIVYLIIFLIGIISGVVFLINASESSKEIIFLNVNNYLQNINNSHINNILYHIVILSILLISSFFVVGIPLSTFLIFYNGFSIGFIISALSYIFGINGIIYGLIYVVITKLFFVLFSFMLITNLYKISKLVINKVIKKSNIKDKIYTLIIKCVFIIGFILLMDILLYFVGVPILNIFNFLII